MSIKGLPFIGKLNEYLDRIVHATVVKTGNSKASLDVRNIGYFKHNTVSLVVEAGSDNNTVKLTGHSAVVGDLFRLIASANNIKEYDIVIEEIVDANTFKLSGYLSANLTAGDTFDLYKPTFERFAADGSSISSISMPPISYNRKQAGSTAQTSVLEDLDTPAASRPMPVAIHSIDGAGITVNAGDLSVSTSHVNDSMSIGDGTRIVAATTNNELKVRDNDTITAVGSTTTAVNAVTTKLGDGSQKTKLTDGTNDVTVKQIGTQVTATDYGIVNNAVLHAWSTAGGGQFVDVKANPSGALTVEATVTSSVLPSGAATETTLTAQNVLIGAVTETAPATDTASSGLNGRLQRIAQRLSSIIGLLPTSLGQKTSAGSLAVVVASDNTVAVSAASLPLPTGASTSALQTTGNTSLSNIDTKLPASLGAKTSAASLSVTPATDAIYNVKPKAVTGTFVSGNVTTVTTLTAPANAIGALIQCPDTSSNNFRALQGGTATASVGIQFQPGRSEEFKSGTDISICSELGTAAYSVQWFVQA